MDRAFDSPTANETVGLSLATIKHRANLALSIREIRAADPARNDGLWEAVFVSSALPGGPALMEGIKAGVGIYLLDGRLDSLTLLAQWAACNAGYDALHMFRTTNDGQVTSDGTAPANDEGARTALWQQVAAALTANGRLWLYDHVTHLDAPTPANDTASPPPLAPPLAPPPAPTTDDDIGGDGLAGFPLANCHLLGGPDLIVVRRNNDQLLTLLRRRDGTLQMLSRFFDNRRSSPAGRRFGDKEDHRTATVLRPARVPRSPLHDPRYFRYR